MGFGIARLFLFSHDAVIRNLLCRPDLSYTSKATTFPAQKQLPMSFYQQNKKDKKKSACISISDTNTTFKLAPWNNYTKDIDRFWAESSGIQQIQEHLVCGSAGTKLFRIKLQGGEMLVSVKWNKWYMHRWANKPFHKLTPLVQLWSYFFFPPKDEKTQLWIQRCMQTNS